jgi:hypothetical protein
MYEKYCNHQIVNVVDPDDEYTVLGEGILYQVEDFQGRDSRYALVILSPFSFNGHELKRGQRTSIHYDYLRPNPYYTGEYIDTRFDNEY